MEDLSRLKKLTKTEATIYSIAILDQTEISEFLQKIPIRMNLELNISCPNIENKPVITGIEQFINPNRQWCILKLSPTTSEKSIDEYYKKGFRQFHCCNTLKTPNGGLSGPSLKPYTSKLVKYISNKYPDTEIIAGGGIQNVKDIEEYRKCGATHFSVSTIFFHPILCFKFFYYLK